MTTCEHEFYYYLAINEEGWKCVNCELRPGEPPGFSPQLDRDEIGMKVMGILHDMHNHGIVHISNGSHGEGIEGAVTERCQKNRLYDQYTIARYILDELQPGHAKYWKEISRGILTGKDKRRRCKCGALADIYTYENGVSVDRCSAHYQTPDAEIAV